MEKAEFYLSLKDEVQAVLSRQGIEAELMLQDVKKANGTILQGLTFRLPPNQMAPCIYLNDAYDRYRKGSSMETLAEAAAESLFAFPLPDLDVEIFEDYEKLKPLLDIKLIGLEGNEDWLKDKVWMPFGDFAAVCYAVQEGCSTGQYMTAILESMLDDLETDRDTLEQDALDNLRRKDVFFEPIGKIIEQITDEAIPDQSQPKMPLMYVLTNRDKYFGAAEILRPEILDYISGILDGDYYILPSSIHEVIIIPDRKDISLSFLSTMVREVNSTQVDNAERLSDQVQYYSRSLGTFTNAVEYLGEDYPPDFQADLEMPVYKNDKHYLS